MDLVKRLGRVDREKVCVRESESERVRRCVRERDSERERERNQILENETCTSAYSDT